MTCFLSTIRFSLLLIVFVAPLNSWSGTPGDLFELELEEVLELELTGAAVRDLALDGRPQTANPFGLTAIELPLSIDVMSRKTMRARGLKSVTEAADNLVGVISGESPAEPSSFSIRGFQRDSVTILRDGIKLGPASMTMRPQNTFNLQQLEIVRGPATLQYGHGTASGFINMVTRKAEIGGGSGVELFAAAASDRTSEFGLGVSKDFSADMAMRIDFNQSQSDGWVNDTNSKSRNITASFAWQALDDVKINLSFDHLEDDLPAYWGTPLLPSSIVSNPISGVITTNDGRQLESATRHINYNVADERSDSEHLWSRLTFDWQLSSDVKLENTLYYFEADRAWQNAESYVFNPDSGLIERDRFFVFHDHRFKGNRFTVNYDHPLLGLNNSLQFNLEYNHTDFLRSRGFPGGDGVDLFAPQPGVFGPLAKRASPTIIESWSFNVEDSLQLSADWRLFAGIRWEDIRLVRDNYDSAGRFIAQDSFTRSFNPFSFHLNAQYQLNQNQSVYGHYSTAHDPVGSNIYLVNAAENFEFADIRQVELGYKAIIESSNTEWTLAYFDIERDNILLLVTHDVVGNSGMHRAHGVELAITTQPSATLRLGGNIGYSHGKYHDFVDPDFGIDAGGNAPPNSPKYVANAWISQSKVAGLDIEVGGGLRYVSERYTNFANTATLSSYVLLNLFVNYTFDKSRIAFNMRNATDKDYAPWADIFYPNQIGIAAGRTIELSFQTSF